MDGINALLKDCDRGLLRNRRANHRKPFVRPMALTLDRSREQHDGFSRDLSRDGLGALLPVKVDQDQPARLSIEMSDGKLMVVFARSRWCEPFGNGWFMTGWQFVR